METPQTLGTQPRVRGGGGVLNRITVANVTETQQRKTNSRAGGWRVRGGGEGGGVAGSGGIPAGG